ncbi:MAG: gamma carbonic anhydrase family protein [Deferrisomatales bacterium]|nr:gamma carbonic anhydrase family protein [Deferrisomatales bacterium]
MIMPFGPLAPRIAPDAFVAPTAAVIGDVELGPEASLWFHTVARADVHFIRIGARTNVQDACVLHVTGGRHPLHIGEDVSIGHRAVVHGCTVGSRVLIGMGAVVLDGARIGDDSIVGAGAVVPEGAEFPPRSVVLGVPARRTRELTEGERERIRRTRDDYLALTRAYRACPPGAARGPFAPGAED